MTGKTSIFVRVNKKHLAELADYIKQFDAEVDGENEEYRDGRNVLARWLYNKFSHYAGRKI